MKKIKYPRYKRNQNLACKLTDKEIRAIRKTRVKESSISKIANSFEVSRATIYRWILSDAERKQMYKIHYLLWDKDRDLKSKHERQIRSVMRKRRLMPRFKEYTKQFK